MWGNSSTGRKEVLNRDDEAEIWKRHTGLLDILLEMSKDQMHCLEAPGVTEE